MLPEKKRIKRSIKTGLLEIAVEFSKERVLFHPLPKVCQDHYKEGQNVKGHYGILHPTGKLDSRGVPIFIQYFIPEGDW